MLQRLKRAYNRYTALKDIEKVGELFGVSIEGSLFERHLNGYYNPLLPIPEDESLFDEIYLKMGRGVVRNQTILIFLTKSGLLDHTRMTNTLMSASLKNHAKILKTFGFETEWHYYKFLYQQIK